MSRFETMGRIVDYLHNLDDAALGELLAELTGEITDATLKVVTRGKDDTEHILGSPVNAADLDEAVKELANQTLLMPQHAS
jgi:hypothetical protein